MMTYGNHSGISPSSSSFSRSSDVGFSPDEVQSSTDRNTFVRVVVRTGRKQHKKHSWCCGTPEPRTFVARCHHGYLRKHKISIWSCRRSVKYSHLILGALITKVRRNQRSKFDWSALSRFGDMSLRTWKRFCDLQTNGVIYNHKICRRCRRYKVRSPVQIWCIYVQPFRR